VSSGATYKPNEHWAFTVAARYSGTHYSTLDNTDTVHGVYQAFDPFSWSTHAFSTDTSCSTRSRSGPSSWRES
jgi:hypothetical protein